MSDIFVVAAWSGSCRNCGQTWKPTPGMNMCPTCGAGPLSRFRDGTYVIRLTEWDKDGKQGVVMCANTGEGQ